MYYTRFHCSTSNYLVKKTEEALRVRYKASGGERDTGVVAGTFFALNIYFLNLPIENPINIGGRGTRVAH